MRTNLCVEREERHKHKFDFLLSAFSVTADYGKTAKR